MRRHATSAGFTLLELLLAVSIFAVVLAAITTVFYSAVRLRNKTTARFEEILPLQQAAAIIQRDLAGLVTPGGTFSGDFKTAALTGANEQSATVFCTTSAVLDDTQPWSEVQKISYFLDGTASAGGGRDLIRAVTRNLLPATSTADSDKQWLLGNVRNLAFTFYDGATWTDSWDSTTKTNLPRAIKVQVELAAADSAQPAPAPLEVVVPIYVTGRTNQTAANANAGGQP